MAPGPPRSNLGGDDLHRHRPRWANIAAHLTVLTTLPSGLWRIPIALGFSMGMLDDGRPIHMHGWESVYVVGLSVVAEGAALLTLGLRPALGRARPGLVPVIRGRRIPPMAVIVPAALGVLALAASGATPSGTSDRWTASSTRTKAGVSYSSPATRRWFSGHRCWPS